MSLAWQPDPPWRVKEPSVDFFRHHAQALATRLNPKGVHPTRPRRGIQPRGQFQSKDICMQNFRVQLHKSLGCQWKFFADHGDIVVLVHGCKAAVSLSAISSMEVRGVAARMARLEPRNELRW